MFENLCYLPLFVKNSLAGNKISASPFCPVDCLDLPLPSGNRSPHGKWTQFCGHANFIGWTWFFFLLGAHPMFYVYLWNLGAGKFLYQIWRGKIYLSILIFQEFFSIIFQQTSVLLILFHFSATLIMPLLELFLSVCHSLSFSLYCSWSVFSFLSYFVQFYQCGSPCSWLCFH